MDGTNPTPAAVEHSYAIAECTTTACQLSGLVACLPVLP